MQPAQLTACAAIASRYHYNFLATVCVTFHERDNKEMNMHMNEKKDIVRRIWQECFHDTPQWMDMFFSSVYDDDDALVLDCNNKAVSSLLLQSYVMDYHGVGIPMGYISGAATRRQERGRGHMSELIRIALRHARHRGDYLVSLIPASRRLFFFYDRMGFSTVFYIKENRYTSLHNFSPTGNYHIIEGLDKERMYEFLSRCESMRRGAVRHSRRDLDNILADNRLDGGEVIAVGREGDEGIVAIGFAVTDDSEPRLVVKDMLAIDEDASQGLLDAFRQLFPDCPFTVVRPVESGDRPIEARAMTRIVNVSEMLAVLARLYTSLKIVIKVSDNIIPENNKIFIVDDGNVSPVSTFSGHIDLDVTVNTLASILFSTPQVGEVFGLPALRPFMSLMLE